MKLFADKHRMERSFEVGDSVLLKIQPYKQTTARGYMPQKLASMYFGPYTVVEKIGKVAYKLSLPPHAKINDVFHISQLKKYKGQHVNIQSDTPMFWEIQPKMPEKILERRMIKRGNRAITQVLIKWLGEDRADATWEDFLVIKQKFPDFNLVAEIVLEDGGVSGFYLMVLASQG